VLADARAVGLRVDALRARARGLTQGLEPELALAVDVMFPMPALVAALDAFRHAFPTVPVRLYVEALGAVSQLVLVGVCRLGIVGPVPPPSPALERHGLAAVTMVPVAAPFHPLAGLAPPIPSAALREHTQLVLTDRSTLTEGIEVGVLSPRNWRLADLGAKHALIKAGLGWGNLPEHLASDDIAAGTLVRLRPAEWPSGVMQVPMQLIHRADDPLGPAARWLLGRLQDCAEAARSTALNPPARSPTAPGRSGRGSPHRRKSPARSARD
jgi:DNA-binding transcriptional LysR family regulator